MTAHRVFIFPILIAFTGCAVTTAQVKPDTEAATACTADSLDEHDAEILQRFVSPAIMGKVYDWTVWGGGDAIVIDDRPWFAEPWHNPVCATYLLREALFNTADCRSQYLKRKALGNCRHISSYYVFYRAVKRLQQDRGNCSLSGDYSEYLSTTSDARRQASMCAYFVSRDPSSLGCLENTQDALAEILLTSWEKHNLPNSPAGGQLDEKYRLPYKQPGMKAIEANYEYTLTRPLMDAPLWLPEYDAVFRWIDEKLVPRFRGNKEAAGFILNMEAIRAYKKGDRDALLKLIVRPRKLGIPEQAVNFLIMLGLQGNEAESLKRMRADTYYVDMFSRPLTSPFTTKDIEVQWRAMLPSCLQLSQTTAPK